MKPILFNTAMVRAILDGRKTVTRRVIKPQPDENADMRFCYAAGRKKYVQKWVDENEHIVRGCNSQKWTPPCCAGDVLYIRETWCDPSGTGYPILYKTDFPIHYEAEETEIGEPIDMNAEDCAWKPSIHMPKDYARIFLRVTRVSVERLQNITDEACANEGIRAWTKDGWLYKYAPADEEGDAPCWKWADTPRSAKDAMQKLWDSTVKYKDIHIYGWGANPWVWVIEFERISRGEAHHE